jgi:hypothetical protein
MSGDGTHWPEDGLTGRGSARTDEGEAELWAGEEERGEGVKMGFLEATGEDSRNAGAGITNCGCWAGLMARTSG